MLLTVADPIVGALLVALLLDGLTGDPDWLYRRIPHPVVLLGRLSTWLEATLREPDAPPRGQQRAGAAATLIVVGVSVALGWLLQQLCLALPGGWVMLAVLMSTLIAGRGLYQHVAAVANGLIGGLEAGRTAVARIVGRDPEQLDAHGIARAAIESTAENFADGVVAPLFWGLLFGLPGLLGYKAINTLDSMIGHRTPRYRHYGRLAARLDDAANWLPARLAALAVLLASPAVGGARPRAGWRAVWRDAGHHRSPNAGWPEAAMAGVLGLRLAGPRRYAGEIVDDAWMGDGRADATVNDIQRALRLLVAALALSALVLGMILAVSLTR